MKRIKTNPRCRRPNRWVDSDRQPLERPRRRWLGLIPAALLLALLALRGEALFEAQTWTSPFEVTEVRVVGAEVSHPGVLVAEAGLAGREMRVWSSFDRHAELVSRDPMVAEVSFERRFPNRVTMVVVERRPVALLRLERLTPVDAEGRVLPISAFYGGWDVPVMTTDFGADQAVEGGRVVVGAVRRSLEWLAVVERELPALYGKISTVEVEDRGMLWLRLASPDCVVALEEDTPIEKLALVDDVLRDLERKGEPYLQIDLRFEDQIIVRRG